MNDELLEIGRLWTTFCEILVKIYCSDKKMNLKTPSAKWWVFCLTTITSVSTQFVETYPGQILALRQANERRRYKVTPPLIGWAQA